MFREVARIIPQQSSAVTFLFPPPAATTMPRRVPGGLADELEVGEFFEELVGDGRSLPDEDHGLGVLETLGDGVHGFYGVVVDGDIVRGHLREAIEAPDTVLIIVGYDYFHRGILFVRIVDD
jgi:hypothetical protein